MHGQIRGPITPAMTIVREAPLTSSAVPPLPPDEVLAEVALAGERVRELRSLGRTFHFGVDAGSGRVTAEMRCLDTGLDREISLASVLEVISGDVLPA